MLLYYRQLLDTQANEREYACFHPRDSALAAILNFQGRILLVQFWSFWLWNNNTQNINPQNSTIPFLPIELNTFPKEGSFSYSE